jgi:hypothetical protein
VISDKNEPKAKEENLNLNLFHNGLELSFTRSFLSAGEISESDTAFFGFACGF